jgi:hypothetical protein
MPKKPPPAEEAVRRRILRTSVRDLKEFGWPEVNDKNIITDEVYSKAFKSNLQTVLDDPMLKRNEIIVRVVKQLMVEIDKANQPDKKEV